MDGFWALGHEKREKKKENKRTEAIEATSRACGVQGGIQPPFTTLARLPTARPGHVLIP